MGSIPGGGGGVTEQIFMRGGFAPRLSPLLFYIKFFTRKVTPCVYFLLTNGTPFKYLVQKFASPAV